MLASPYRLWNLQRTSASSRRLRTASCMSCPVVRCVADTCFTRACYMLHASHVHATCYMLHATSYKLHASHVHATCFMLHATCFTRACYMLHMCMLHASCYMLHATCFTRACYMLHTVRCVADTCFTHASSYSCRWPAYTRIRILHSTRVPNKKAECRWLRCVFAVQQVLCERPLFGHEELWEHSLISISGCLLSI